jgi:hypothetical protein
LSLEESPAIKGIGTLDLVNRIVARWTVRLFRFASNFLLAVVGAAINS